MPEAILLDQPTSIVEAEQLAALHHPDVVVAAATIDDRSTLPMLAAIRQVHSPGSTLVVFATSFNDRVFGEFHEVGVTGYFLWSELDRISLVPSLGAILAGNVVTTGQAVALHREAQRVQDMLPGDPIQFTENERLVLRLLAAGHSRTEICGEGTLCRRTVTRNIASLYAKLEAQNDVQLGIKARAPGLVR